MGEGGRYTVKQVAAMTGVLETTLRVWERRYGVVSPQRSDGGYRLYTDADVATLRAMAGLVFDGVPASRAARTVLEQAPVTREPSSMDDLDLVAAAVSLNPRHLESVLRAAMDRASLAEVCEVWLMPQLTKLGLAWEAGEATVAHEHFASAGVTRMLGRAFAESQPAETSSPVLVGNPPGAHHVLGLLAFATCLRDRGVDVVYLGADVPVTDWAAAAASLRPRAAVVGMPQGANARHGQEVVNRLLSISPPISVWVGGSRAGRVHGAERLPDAVATAAHTVATALGAARPVHA